MKQYLVGYTGFVGGNLHAACHYEGLFNSKNITDAYGGKPDLLIYSGVRAEKFLANAKPEQDAQIIEQAIANIQAIAPKKVILISTVDVYQQANNVDEDTFIETQGLHPYGLNRYALEQWIRDAYDDYLIVRLPALFGPGLKKNFLYDFLHPMPSMLNNDKYQELVTENASITTWYADAKNGFYKVNILSKEDEQKGITYFKNIGFTSLSFTDSRTKFQFYGLHRLYEDIQRALQQEIKQLNLVTEPVSAAELYAYLANDVFENIIHSEEIVYDVKTKYAKYFGGHDGYLQTKEEVLKDIRTFVGKY